MTVEITPSGPAKVLAQQLLAVAENHPDFHIRDVQTTTSGPQGLAFVVPDELHEAWLAAYAPKPAPEASDEDLKPRRRGPKAKTAEEE